MSSTEPPSFEVGQAVRVNEGLPGEITAVKRGVVRGVLGLSLLDTCLYTVTLPKAAATNRPKSQG